MPTNFDRENVDALQEDIEERLSNNANIYSNVPYGFTFELVMDAASKEEITSSWLKYIKPSHEKEYCSLTYSLAK